MDYKTALMPIISALALFYGTVTGHAVPKDTVDLIVLYASAIVLFATNVWGIYKNHKK
jgi:hypothetical protein